MHGNMWFYADYNVGEAQEDDDDDDYIYSRLERLCHLGCLSHTPYPSTASSQTQT